MNEQTIKLEKVKKSCKIAKKVASVLQIIFIVATALLVICAAVMYFGRDTINTNMAQAIENSGITPEFGVYSNMNIINVTVDSSMLAKEGDYALAIAVTCIGSAIVCGIAAIVFTLIRGIFVALGNSESPFNNSVLNKIKKIFIALTIIVAIETGLVFGLFLALFFWCLYCIMDYGFALQKEIDETL